MAKQIISLRIDTDVLGELDRLAKANMRSRSSMIAALVRGLGGLGANSPQIAGTPAQPDNLTAESILTQLED